MPKKQKVVTRKQRKALEAAETPPQSNNNVNAAPTPEPAPTPAVRIVVKSNIVRPGDHAALAKFGPVVVNRVRMTFLEILHYNLPPAAVRLVQLDLPELLGLYARYGGDLRQRDQYGLSAIHYAAHLNRYDCARVLLAYAGGTARPHHPLTFLSLLTRR
jgi:hypothetical protein